MSAESHGIAGLPEYRQRAHAFLDLWQEGSWRLKVYGIHHDPSRLRTGIVDPAVAASARIRVRQCLSEAEREGGHYGMGVVIIHHGLAANWLLFNWWAHDNICCEALSRSAPEMPQSFEPYDGSAMACVYELVVIDFERRAWIETMLRKTPDRDAYLATRLPNGLY